MVLRKNVVLQLLRPALWRHRYLLVLADFLLRPIAWLLQPRRTLGDSPEKQILVFVPGHLGDVAMLLPFLQVLRRERPQARITVLSYPGAGFLVLRQGLADRYVELEMPWKRQQVNPFSRHWGRFFVKLMRLRKERFELAFSAGHCNLRTHLVVLLAGARRRIGYGSLGGEYMLTDVIQPDVRHPHGVEMHLALLRGLGLPGDWQGPALRLREADHRRAREILRQVGIEDREFLVAIHPGAGVRTRQWGEERFAAVSRHLVECYGATVLWFTDPSAPRPAPPEARAKALALPLEEFIAVLGQCALFIGNDSGPMHLASALDLPIVAVFGPTCPEWYGPWGRGPHRVVIRGDMWCRPCGDQCRWSEPYCLRLIEVEEVIAAVDSLIQELKAQGRWNEWSGKSQPKATLAGEGIHSQGSA